MRAPEATQRRARKLRSELSLPEKLLWVRLRRREPDLPNFRRQHPVGPFVLDFYCSDALLCVEVDSAWHHVGDRQARDAERDAWLSERGVKVVRIPASKVLQDPDAIADWVRHLAREQCGANRKF